MKILLLISFVLFQTLLVLSQEIKTFKFETHLTTGFAKQTSTDQLLNYFNYSGKTGLPINTGISYTNNKHLVNFDFYFHKSTLKPANIQNVNYEYNYINNQHIEINLEYFYRIYNINKIAINIGLTGNLYSILQEEYYKSLLLTDKSMRKSYDYSLFNLSPSISVELPVKRHIFRIKTNYTIFNIAARPDDNYVKQFGYKSQLNWKFYSSSSFFGYNIQFHYNYEILRKISITTSYKIQYHSYSGTDKYKYLQKALLIGISKIF